MTVRYSEPQEGEIFAGKYRVDRILGRGGMGVVLAATHLVLHHQVALKFLLPAAALESETIARFLREARVTAQLKGAHVAKTLDVGQLDDGRPFLVMELLDGHDLDTELASSSDRPIADVLSWILQACEGLAEAHAAGIVHRDLKPSNLFLARDPSGNVVVKVLDFGISKLVTGRDEALTGSASTFGTPLYMSPEQLRSSKGTDERSDVWSLGVILYEALCGQPPFRGETVFAIAQSVTVDAPEPPAARRKDIPLPLSAAIMRCLAKDPRTRTQSVAELAEALAPFSGAGGAEQAKRVRSAFDPSSPRRPVVSKVPPPPDPRSQLEDGPTVIARSARPGERPWGTWLVLGAIGAIAFASGAWALARSRERSTEAPVSTPVPSASGIVVSADGASGSVPKAVAPRPVESSMPMEARTTVGSANVTPPRIKKKEKTEDAAAPTTPTSSTPSSPFIDQRTN